MTLVLAAGGLLHACAGQGSPEPPTTFPAQAGQAGELGAQPSAGSSGSQAPIDPPEGAPASGASGSPVGSQQDSGAGTGPALEPGPTAGTAGSAAADAGVDASQVPVADAGGGGAPPPGICPDGPFAEDPLPPMGQRTAQLVRGGFRFLEGPVWHAELGALFFSDMDFGQVGERGAASRIHRFVPPASFEVFIADSGSNGLALDLEGQLLAATHDAQTLSRFDPRDGTRTTLPLDYMGNPFNSPNDLVVRADGTVYFTDPDWQLPPRQARIGFTGVYRLAPDGELSLIDRGLDKPNGIALSPDQRTLYVGSSGSQLLAYPLDESGTPGTSTVLAMPGASDGFALDCAGNLYVTAQSAVIVYAPSGRERGRIAVPEGPSNAAFGGADRRTLYVTARTGLYSIALPIPGYPY